MDGLGVTEQTVSAVLSVRDLRKWFPVKGGGLLRRKQWVKALDGVSLDLHPGDTLGIVGESGCGKSTLAETLMWLSPPTHGSIAYGGRSLAVMSRRELQEYRRQVQMVFQDPYESLNPKMTVLEIVTEPWRIHRNVYAQSEWEGRARDLMEMVGLRSEVLSALPTRLSGGQRQRVGIARALALSPSVLICDEPTSALDVSVQAQVLNLLAEVRSRLDLSAVFISHDLSVVRYFCNRVAVMYLGRVVEQGPIDEVFDRPVHPYTQALLSAVPDPDVAANGQSSRIVLHGEVPTPLDRPTGCAFRTRCWRAEELCVTSDPMLEDATGHRHQSACHFPEPLSHR